ncbi:hypothetical protein [Bifidobacterium bifidum]
MSDFLNTSRPINGILHSSAASGVTSWLRNTSLATPSDGTG